MLKLTYFNLAGRAYVTRCCLNLAGIPFEDEIITFQQLQDRRGPTGVSPTIPLGSVPVLTLPNGKVVIQSGAILRYAAKLANLYPTDPSEAIYIDEIVETVMDFQNSVPQSTDPETKKTLRMEFAENKMKKFFNFFADKLTTNPGGYIVGKSLTVADFSLYCALKILRKGVYDHIAADYDAQWPIFQTYIDRMESDPVTGKFKI